ncbi:hypothetical protein C1646_249804 [Rhizophagus diaphanus]|nr:hypothetical protein C1646_249804 [Rhizophagus diaphanus] [Rhizophagus sp. MUCL 43196]
MPHKRSKISLNKRKDNSYSKNKELRRQLKAKMERLEKEVKAKEEEIGDLQIEVQKLKKFVEGANIDIDNK